MQVINLTAKIEQPTNQKLSMKTNRKVLTKVIVGGLFPLALTALVWLPVRAEAADQKKGAEFLINDQVISRIFALNLDRCRTKALDAIEPLIYDLIVDKHAGR